MHEGAQLHTASSVNLAQHTTRSMASSGQPWHLISLLLIPASVVSLAAEGSPMTTSTPVFDENYVGTWGADGYHLVNQGTEIRLTMDRSSGAGFVSKLSYGAGFFHMRIKLPAGYTAGVVTTFYLASASSADNGGRDDHDEVDFEFLGDVDGKPITLQTNLYVNGAGDREQRMHLWFDPSADFHDYKILWNPYQLVLFVDETPVRVHRNLTSSVPGYEFPAKTMLVEGSMWDGSGWATDGGETKVDWSRAPFTAGYQGFQVDACAATNSAGATCGSPDLWWNSGQYRSLTTEQQATYQSFKKAYFNYDYCTDEDRFKTKMPVECTYN